MDRKPVTRLHHLRPLPEPVTPAAAPRSERTGGMDAAGGQNPAAMPDRQLLYLIMEAARCADQEDWQGTVSQLCQVAFVAAFQGPQGLTETELLRELGRVADFGFSAPEGPGAA